MDIKKIFDDFITRYSTVLITVYGFVAICIYIYTLTAHIDNLNNRNLGQYIFIDPLQTNIGLTGVITLITITLIAIFYLISLIKNKCIKYILSIASLLILIYKINPYLNKLTNLNGESTIYLGIFFIIGLPLTIFFIIIPYVILLIVENKKGIRVKNTRFTSNKYYILVVILSLLFIFINILSPILLTIYDS